VARTNGETSSSMSDMAARQSWVHHAIMLEYFSIAWMVAEGGLSFWAGIAAHSLSLEVFGLDSLIEVISAGVVLWWLRVEKAEPSSERGEHAEKRAAYVVAGCLLALALYIVAGVVQSLASREVPSPGPLGFAVSVAAIIVMPLLWRQKRRLGEALESQALEEDGVGNLACGWMALILLVSLFLQRLGLWWADPLASVALGIFIGHEGLEAWGSARGVK
jgi:divalent metal cation (Fe/Co/Zn/Cd) transporter